MSPTHSLPFAKQMGCLQSSGSNRVAPSTSTDPDIPLVSWTLDNNDDNNAPPPYTEEAQNGHVTLLRGSSNNDTSLGISYPIDMTNRSTMEIMRPNGVGGASTISSMPSNDNSDHIFMPHPPEPRPHSVYSDQSRYYNDDRGVVSNRLPSVILQHVTHNGHTFADLPHLMPLPLPLPPIFSPTSDPAYVHRLPTHNHRRRHKKHRKKRRHSSDRHSNSNHDNSQRHHGNSHHHHDNNSQRRSRTKLSNGSIQRIQLPPLRYDELGCHDDQQQSSDDKQSQLS